MIAARPNLLRIVESIYRIDLNDNDWLITVADGLRPLIDMDSLGTFGALYQCQEPAGVVPTRVIYHDVPESLRCALDLSPDDVSSGILRRSVFFGAEVRGWQDTPCVQTGALRRHGAADLLSLSAVTPDGTGCRFAGFQKTGGPLSATYRLTLKSVARHLAAAYRLRHRLQMAAILPEPDDAELDDSSGRRGAAYAAAGSPMGEALEFAMRALFRRRSSSCGTGRVELVDQRQRSAAPRWTLVESFEREGRACVLAMANRPKRCGAARWSRRERDVVQHALLGHRNKVIAYDLGLAASTVRVLISRAAAKVGARSRQELLEKAAALGPAMIAGQ
jgi:DNA-binding CsgD family transcriptional regulator